MWHIDELNVDIDREYFNINTTVNIRVPVCHESKIKELLQSNKVELYEIIPSKQHRRFAFETGQQFQDFNSKTFDYEIVAKRYLTHDEINTYIDKIAELMAAKRTNVRVSVNIEGYSYERRPIKSIVFEYVGKMNPVVVIDAGVHAREWHSRSLALYALKKLIEEADLDTRGIIYNTSFIIIPDVNSDGYEYSRTVVSIYVFAYLESTCS
jgi:murein tripeptide amidase MpaA